MSTSEKNLYEEIFNIQVANSVVKASLQETWVPEKIISTSSYEDNTKRPSNTLLASVKAFYDDYEWQKENQKTIEKLGGTIKAHPAFEYRFKENEYIDEAMKHIDKTYSQHYGGEIQATEVIIDAGHGTGFNIGNIIKYAKRYGKKDGFNKADLLKIIHYATMQLYVHDKEKLG